MAGHFGLVLLSVSVLLVWAGSLDPSQEVAVRNVFREMLKISPPSSDHDPPVPPKHMLELYQKYTTGGGPRRVTGNTVRNILPTPGHYQSGRSVLLVFNVTCVDQSEEVHLAQLHLHRRRLPRHHNPHSHYSRRFLAPPYRVRLYQVLQQYRGKTRTLSLASIPVPHASRGGWHSLDITPVLRELLFTTQAPSLPFMLGVRFEAPKGKAISPEHFLRDPEAVTNNTVGTSSAFLVVFSEDNPDNELQDDTGENQVQLTPTHTHAMAELLQNIDDGFVDQNHVVNPVDKSILKLSSLLNRSNEDFYIETTTEKQTNIEEDKSLRHRHRSENEDANNIHENYLSFDRSSYFGVKRGRKNRKHERLTTKLGKMALLENAVVRKPLVLHANEIDEDIQTESLGRRRMVRSIFDNELPDNEAAPTQSVPRTSPGNLLRQRPTTGTSGLESREDPNILPFPSSRRWRGSKKGRRGRGKKKDHRKRNRKLPDNWQQAEKDPTLRQDGGRLLDSTDNVQNRRESCRRKKLVVKFSDIGWSDFIIAPPDFEAHYCSGRCSFPLAKGLKPTNHATIQSLVHVMGTQPEVPPPCCVPDHLSSRTLLYMDEMSNVVLKTYPSMTVDTCGCR